jgi:hypothetical protein
LGDSSPTFALLAPKRRINLPLPGRQELSYDFAPDR